MPTDETYKWQIWCVTEQAYVYIWNTIQPTSCPNDVPGETAHTINVDSISIVETMHSSDVVIKDSEVNLHVEQKGFLDLSG